MSGNEFYFDGDSSGLNGFTQDLNDLNDELEDFTFGLKTEILNYVQTMIHDGW